MMIQSFLSDVVVVIVEIMYNVPNFFDKNWYLYLSMYGLIPGLTPVFCMVTDQTVRNCVKMMIRKNIQISPTVVGLKSIVVQSRKPITVIPMLDIHHRPV